ncbi:hypothetical protein [Mastigocladopsis repens]|uniref:hypothetical protein n=1 Tax=Mastigocladopsis repens TaxID=221287 RepID=UPI001E4E90C4|nr:hypothetical protein [Mastigocladopsis repens]
MTTTSNALIAPLLRVQEAFFKNRSKMALFLLLTTVGFLGTISMKNSGVFNKNISIAVLNY